MVPVLWFCDRVRQRDLSAGIRSRDHGVLTCRCSSAKSGHFSLYCTVKCCALIRSESIETLWITPKFFCSYVAPSSWLLKKAKMNEPSAVSAIEVLSELRPDYWIKHSVHWRQLYNCEFCDVWNFPIRCSRLKIGQIYHFCFHEKSLHFSTT